MKSLIRQPLKLLSLSIISATLALSANYTMGYAAFDLTLPANVGELDIINETGVNSTVLPDTTFPISSTLSFTGETLTVHFKSGTISTYGSSYFTPDADGISLDGTSIFNVAVNPISYAVITGTLSSTSITLNDGTTATISPNFSVTITDPSGTLQDGDIGIITTSPGTGTNMPEPATWPLVCVGLGLCALGRRAARRSICASATLLVLILSASILQLSAATTVRLNEATTPGTGVSGSSQVYVAGTGFQNPIAASGVTVSLSATCGGSVIATTPALSVTQVIGSSDRVEFLIPGSIIKTAFYYVSLSGTNSAGVPFTSSDCSAIQINHTSTAFASCNPGSSMGVLVPNPVSGTTVPVTAYVPNSSWFYAFTTGVQAVPIEGSGSASAIPTADYINSCSTNSVTGESVCTANNTKVYLISGTTVQATLTSGARHESDV
jgi:hypothetical protein